MPRGGARPNSGGARPGAGRKAAGVPTMRSLTVRLPEPTHELVSELRERLQLESAGEVIRRAIEALDAAQR